MKQNQRQRSDEVIPENERDCHASLAMTVKIQSLGWVKPNGIFCLYGSESCCLALNNFLVDFCQKFGNVQRLRAV